MARPTKRQQINKKISESMSKMTPDCINKLKEAFAIDASIEEACYYADISIQTYYNWKEKNPELFESITRLREKPVLKARQTIVTNLDKVASAQWYIERKRPDEFSTKTKVEHSGMISDDSALSEKEEEIASKYEQEIDETIKNSVTKKTHGQKGKDTGAKDVHQTPKTGEGTRVGSERSVPNGKPS